MKLLRNSIILILSVILTGILMPTGVMAADPPVMHTVTFYQNKDDKDEGRTPLAYVTIEQGNKIAASNVPDPLDITGWRFQGYAIMSDDPEMNDSLLNFDIDPIFEDYEVYAKYERIELVLTFDTNAGGDVVNFCGGNNKTKTYDIFHSQSFKDVYGSFPVPTRTGYDFQYWYDSTDPGQNQVSVYNLITDNWTYNALWREKNYTISFDLNLPDGEVPLPGDSPTPSSQTIPYRSILSLETPVHDGFIFMGWNENKFGSGKKYQNGDKFETAKNITLCATWKRNYRDLKFALDGKEFLDPDKTVDDYTKRVTFGKKYSETYGPFPELKPLEGYTFQSWYDLKNGQGHAIDGETIVSTDQNDTLHPFFTPNSYEVTFDPNGGECNVDKKTVTYNLECTWLPVPTLYGYDFTGWETDMGVKLTSADKYKIASDTTLTATWTEKQVIISFDPCGGSMTGFQSTVTRRYNNKYSIGTKGLPLPTKLGYHFVGWYTAKEEDRGVRIDDNSIIKNEKNHTLYARWNPIPYRVSFDSCGGEGETPSKIVMVGDTYGELPVVTQPGFEFDGWFTAPSGGNRVTSDTQLLVSNLILYAQWKPKVMTVTFDPCGGNVSQPSKQVTYNNIYGTLPVPSRKDYDFDGWYTDKELTWRVNSNSVVQTKNSHSLYAGWVYNPPHVTPTPTGGPTPTKGPNPKPTEGPVRPTGTPTDASGFKDVPKGSWYYSAVDYAVKKGILNGVGGNLFDPNGVCTREQFVQMLYNASNQPAVSHVAKFKDVPDGKWYSKAISWAVSYNIVSGISNTKFGVGEKITREQAALMLMKFAAYNKRDTERRSNIIKYKDAMEISSWAQDAMSWANYEKIIAGYNDGRLAPKDYCTRAQVAQMMKNYYGGK